MNITKEDWIGIAKNLVISRLIDTIEESELAPSGKVLYQFSSKGHELGQIILAHFMNNPHDGATVYYRSRPFRLPAFEIGPAKASSMVIPAANTNGLER